MIKQIRKYLNMRNSFVFVYQMGKVGSDAIVQALGSDKSEHIHTFYGKNQNDKYIFNNSRPKRIKDAIHFFIKRLAIKVIFKKIKIITIVRDPFARDVSMFFQDIEAYIYKYRNKSFYNYIQFNKSGTSPLITLFENCYDFEYGLNWFDKELKRFTGIDIYQYKPQNGTIRIETKKYSILCLHINSIYKKRDIISDFSGKEVTIKASNDGRKKWYSEIYKEFKKNINNQKEAYNSRHMDSKLVNFVSQFHAQINNDKTIP